MDAAGPQRGPGRRRQQPRLRWRSRPVAAPPGGRPYCRGLDGCSRSASWQLPFRYTLHQQTSGPGLSGGSGTSRRQSLPSSEPLPPNGPSPVPVPHPPPPGHVPPHCWQPWGQSAFRGSTACPYGSLSGPYPACRYGSTGEQAGPRPGLPVVPGISPTHIAIYLRRQLRLADQRPSPPQGGLGARQHLASGG